MLRIKNRRQNGLLLCSICQEYLPEDCFSKDSSKKTGRATLCRECIKSQRVGQHVNRFKGSKIRKFKVRTWEGINARTINGQYPYPKNPKVKKNYLDKGIELRMGKEEYFSWVDGSIPILEKLWEEGKVPSIDRVDSSGHYEIANLQIIDRTINLAKSAPSRRKGKVAAKDPVTGDIVMVFDCSSQVKEHGFCRSSVCSCLSGQRKRHRNLIWEYLNEGIGKNQSKPGS